MDVYTTNQSQSWIQENSCPPASIQGPHSNTLPRFQHLNLGSAFDQSPASSNCQESTKPPLSQHTWDYQKNMDISFPSSHAYFNSHYNASHVVHCSPSTMPHANPTSQQAVLAQTNASQSRPLSAMHSNASQQKEVTPSSLPFTKNQEHPPLSPYSPQHGSNNTTPISLLPPCTEQHVFKEATSPYHRNTPSSLPLSGQCLNQGHHSTPHSPFGSMNSAPPLPPAGHEAGDTPSHVTMVAPILQQPRWMIAPHDSGGIYKPVSQEAGHPEPQALEGSSTPQSPGSESRYGLDAKLLPSAVQVMVEDRADWEGKVFVSEPPSSLPPLATTFCDVDDRGNASPRAVRSTTYCVPCQAQAAQLSRLPLGALLSPLARRTPGERPLPLCREPECLSGCGECGASMSPVMSWQDCGQRFYCPFCGQINEVPWQHYQPTKGVEGIRVDRDKRPELCVGSYDIIHPQKDEAAVLLLAIDVSASALGGGHLDIVTQQIGTLLNSLKREDGIEPADVRVGLMTYDSRIHLYDLNPALSRPHMLVVMETEDLLLPLREGLLVSLKDCIDSIDSVLQAIPMLSPEGEDSCGVPIELPIKAGLAVLQGMNCPGKLLLFHASPLIEGAHTHFSGFFGSNKPKSIFQPSECDVSLAKECTNQGCGVHLFIISQQDVGGAWPGNVPYLTGGVLYTYNHLQGEMERERFSSDLRRTVEAETVYKAQIRVNVSKDLRVSGCYGVFVPGDRPSQVALATIDCRTTLAVELAYISDLDEKRGVAIQVAATYSDPKGQRRTRVHTLILRSSRHLLDTFRHCQAQALLAFYCKKMYCAVMERPLQELRGELQAELTEVLACYRKHCSSASVSTGQLVLPQHLRPLPVYVNSLRKSEVLLPGLRSSVHQRLQLRCQVLCMDTPTIATHFYPMLLPLPMSVEDSSDTRPPDPAEGLRCTAASLEQGRLYLVSGPLALLLWVGSHVPSHTLVQLFNASCFSSLLSGETKLPALDNALSTRVCCLIDLLNSQTPYARKLWVVKQGDSCEEALQRHLVEDKSPNGGASYADFLYHLHVHSVRLLQ